jgi:hypothetical protein
VFISKKRRTKEKKKKKKKKKKKVIVLLQASSPSSFVRYRNKPELARARLHQSMAERLHQSKEKALQSRGVIGCQACVDFLDADEVSFVDFFAVMCCSNSFCLTEHNHQHHLARFLLLLLLFLFAVLILGCVVV